MKRRLEWFFGPQKAKRLDEMVSCTYYELLHDDGGTELSLDDAVKMAHDQHESSCP